MSRLIEVRINGVKEIQDRMNQMADHLQKRMLVDIMKKSLEQAKVEAETRAPTGNSEAKGAFQKTLSAKNKMMRSSGSFSTLPGYLKKSFRIKKMRSNNPFLIEVQLQNTAYYALWVEYGHRIVKGRGKNRRVVGSTAPQDFMRSTFRSQKDNIVDQVVKGIEAGLVRRGL